jgi:2-polyprenyl-3-methyl-5-hydroxy-6-metoxy-1,4-benzoquinol methylase
MTIAAKTQNTFEKEVAGGERFEFGANWARFLSVLDERRIADAEEALRGLLGVTTLAGKTFLDIGSGSGLSSLVAARLGARVHSFDYDPQSVACTEYLKSHFAPKAEWTIERGSALDPAYLKKLGTFDVVYSWGVLHHTGQMWPGLEDAANSVAPGGMLAIAIYHDQGWRSRYWLWVKKTYNANVIGRMAMVLLHLPSEYLLRVTYRIATGRLNDKSLRGMSYWHDFIDWVGGYPFEVATPAQLIGFFEKKGFELKHQILTKGHGCNEIVMQRKRP